MKKVNEKRNFFQQFLEDKDLIILDNLYRFNGLLLINRESVREHTYNVLLFSRLLAKELGINKKSLLLEVMDYALLHDVCEIFDFDVNYTVKYNSYNGESIRTVLDNYTKFRMNEKLKQGLNDYFKKSTIESNELVKFIVKVGDWLSCVFYLTKEKRLGNKGVEIEYRRSLECLDEYLKKFISWLSSPSEYFENNKERLRLDDSILLSLICLIEELLKN